jgi:hypothetical protein
VNDFFLFSPIHPQLGQVAPLYSPLSPYAVEIKSILCNRHRQRVETTHCIGSGFFFEKKTNMLLIQQVDQYFVFPLFLMTFSRRFGMLHTVFEESHREAMSTPDPLHTFPEVYHLLWLLIVPIQPTFQASSNMLDEVEVGELAGQRRKVMFSSSKNSMTLRAVCVQALSC